MSSQFVDINADGHNDILVGSFSGGPYIIMGGEKGYSKPIPVVDREGERVLIADFWNDETDEWDSTDRSGSEGHCTSVAAVDWDDDGDLDLILGDYYGGRLYLRRNEGSAEKPEFAVKNEPIMADGKPVVVENGLATPRITDWNDDGLFDILLGGSKGGVFVCVNRGEAGRPEFASLETVIAPFEDSSDSYVKQVPAVNGLPSLPGSSYHIETYDYDGDGDLDLLVGARSSWQKSDVPELTEEQKAEAEKLQARADEIMKEFRKLVEDVESTEEMQQIQESEEYQALMKEHLKIWQQLSEYDTDAESDGDFVWLFRRR